MIERRPFGRTGHLSTATLFGGAALARASQADADRTLDLLLQYGVNHIDTAARYGDSELRIGPWMARHRKDFFLATKTGSRTAPEAREDLHRSLERLRVDHVDLIQLHSLGHPDDWDQAMGPGGALEALIDAREEGLARFIGVTGHGWTIAARCTGGASRASTSTPCSCRTTSSWPSRSATREPSRKCWAAARNGTSRSRASSLSPAGPRPPPPRRTTRGP